MLTFIALEIQAKVYSNLFYILSFDHSVYRLDNAYKVSMRMYVLLESHRRHIATDHIAQDF